MALSMSTLLKESQSFSFVYGISTSMSFDLKFSAVLKLCDFNISLLVSSILDFIDVKCVVELTNGSLPLA